MKDEIQRLFEKLGIECSEPEMDDFVAKTMHRLWNEYKKDCMDQMRIIENQVNELQITIPNGTVGKEYEITFVISKELVNDYWIDGLETTGLKYTIADDNTCQIEGTPTEAGTFEITLSYKYKDWIEGKPILQRKFSIAINPDPKTLWKNIPTPENIEYYQPDYANEYVKVEAKDGVPQKDIVAASQRGRSHAHEGNPRDDHFRVEYHEGSGWYVMAVADGAGSAKYSREGSAIACDTSVEHCIDFFDNQDNVRQFEEYITTYKDSPDGDFQKLMTDEIYKLVGNAVFKAHRAIKVEAEAKGEPLKSYHTTLLFAVCKQFSFGWFVASYWVGDGAMGIYDKDRQYFKMLGVPDGGEFAGQTRFLTMPEMFKDANAVYSRLRFSIEEDFTALMLMTDGVSDPWFETDANLNKIEKWNELYDNITNEVELTDDNTESQNQLLKWLDFWSQGNHDDRTIAILY